MSELKQIEEKSKSPFSGAGDLKVERPFMIMRDKVRSEDIKPICS